MLLLLSCGAHTQRTGLILTEGDRAVLVEPTGRETPLVLQGEAQAVQALGGCTVEVEGARKPGGFTVEGWTVKDAGFGAAPFVGRLRRAGSTLYLDDRTTKTRLQIDPSRTAGLENAVGGIVLIEGVIVGRHVLKVITWRGLLAPGGGNPGPG